MGCFDKKQRYQSFYFEEPIVTGDTTLAMIENTALSHFPVGSFLSYHVCALLGREIPDQWIRKRGTSFPTPLILQT
jgi:hypothetical protein